MNLIMPGPQPGGGGGGSAPVAAKTAMFLGITGTPGSGSTNTKITRFNLVLSDNDGADFTMTDSTTLGTYFRIVTPGIYFVNAAGQLTSATYAAIARAAALSNAITLTNATDSYPLGIVADAASIITQSGFINCSADDYIFFLHNGTVTNVNTGIFKFGLIGPF